MQTMQSENYVPGVSGWKIDMTTGAFQLASDRVVVDGTDPKAIYSGKSRPKDPKPFITVDGVTYISQAEVDRLSMPKAAVQGAQILFHADRIEVWSGGVCRMKYPG